MTVATVVSQHMKVVPNPMNRGRRLAGIDEHFERALFFFSLAKQQPDATDTYRLCLAAAYSCRAIVELMLEAAKEGEVEGLSATGSQEKRKEFEPQIASAFPFYSLLERIRIHDFHRFGIVPPDPAVRRVFLGGPMKLNLQRGGAAISATTEGPKATTYGNATIDFQRPLLVDDGAFFDEQSSRHVSLEELLGTFLREAPAAIEKFAKCLT